ncbi:MAG: glycosyltransferase [Clostridiaceae bacterium]|nr:glycosyltransferase [Clostridiaceae bacterium]
MKNYDNLPLFSVITVCFNSENYIEKTIKSVLRQDFDNYEYLVIDGASTDKTVCIIEQYLDRFGGKLQYISEKDSGIYDAMNKGIGNCSGRYIIFINSDDILDDGALRKAAEFINKNEDAQIVYGDSTNIYKCSGSNFVTKFVKAPSSISKSYADLPLGMCNIRHQSMFTHKMVFDELGRFDTSLRIYADWDFFIHALNTNVKFSYLNTNISYYTMDGVSMNPDYIERHKVREKNSMYKRFDSYYLKDILSIHNILRKILGLKTYYKLQYIVSKRKSRRFN